MYSCIITPQIIRTPRCAVPVILYTLHVGRRADHAHAGTPLEQRKCWRAFSADRRRHHTVSVHRTATMSPIGRRPTVCTRQQYSPVVLHVPKTGTSFVLAVIRAACPAVPHDWSPTCEALTAFRAMAGIARVQPSCGRVAETVPYGSGARPVIRGYIRGSLEMALKAFPQSVCCASFPQLLRLHHPLGAHVLPHNMVVMLRAPRQRLLSSFYAGLHVGGEDALDPERRAALYANVTCPAAFARFAGVANCQTKMLIGCTCGSICGGVGDASAWTSAHDEALSRATRTLDAALVVGLTEEFALSVRLLHDALGLPSPPNTTTANVRPGVLQASEGRVNQMRTGDSAGGHRNGDGQGSSSITYDERELKLDYAHAWTATQPWSGCRGIGRAPFIAWNTPTKQLEALDDKTYAHAVQQFWRGVRRVETGRLS